MKLLAVNASLRGEKGHTGFLLEKIFDGARKAGAECESVVLNDQKINRCLSCHRCQMKEHFLTCVYKNSDDVESIFEKMAVADIVIYATPIYVFTVSSLLKMLLERMYSTGDGSDLQLSRSGLLFHHIDRRISSKPFVALITCDNLEDETPKNAISYFATFSKFMDAPQVGLLVRNGGRMAGYGRDVTRQRIFPRLKQIYAAYEQAGHELATLGHISSSTRHQANQEMLPVPFFHILKRFRPFKNKFLQKAREMIKLGVI